MPKNKKHRPSLTEHRRLWVLTLIVLAAYKEIAKTIRDVLPIRYYDFWAGCYGRGAHRSLLTLQGAFDDFAARDLYSAGVDWAMHFSHDTPQGDDIRSELGELVARALAQPVESISDVHKGRVPWTGFGSF